MYCRKCGTEIYEGDAFCGGCGISLAHEKKPKRSAPAKEKPSFAQKQQEEATTSKGSGLGIGVTIILFIAAILVSRFLIDLFVN